MQGKPLQLTENDYLKQPALALAIAYSSDAQNLWLNLMD